MLKERITVANSVNPDTLPDSFDLDKIKSLRQKSFEELKIIAKILALKSLSPELDPDALIEKATHLLIDETAARNALETIKELQERNTR
ncbi:MAG: hypothetical protein ABIB61_04065 [Candidatus Shapirobacteria bacterium]